MKTFQYFDKNGSGTIDNKELKAALQKYGYVSHVSIEAILNEADEDKSGDISFEEFCKYIAPKLKRPPSDVIKTCFKVQTTYNCATLIIDMFTQIYDVNGDGHLGVDETMKLASDLGYGTINISQACELIAMVDDDGDGRISFDGQY